MKTALLDCRDSRYFFKGAYGQNVALGESNAEIGLTSATTTLHIFCVYGNDLFVKTALLDCRESRYFVREPMGSM